MRVTCRGCGGEFEAARRSAQWCSDRCRKAAKREAEPVGDLAVEPEDTGLVAAVRRDLEAADAVGTFNGQLALTLARKAAAIDATGVPALSKELSRVMALALGEQPPAASPDKPADPDDELRERRDAKREAARQAAD